MSIEADDPDNTQTNPKKGVLVLAESTTSIAIVPEPTGDKTVAMKQLMSKLNSRSKLAMSPRPSRRPFHSHVDILEAQKQEKAIDPSLKLSKSLHASFFQRVYSKKDKASTFVFQTISNPVNLTRISKIDRVTDLFSRMTFSQIDPVKLTREKYEYNRGSLDLVLSVFKFRYRRLTKVEQQEQERRIVKFVETWHMKKLLASTCLVTLFIVGNDVMLNLGAVVLSSYVILKNLQVLRFVCLQNYDFLKYHGIGVLLETWLMVLIMTQAVLSVLKSNIV